MEFIIIIFIRDFEKNQKNLYHIEPDPPPLEPEQVLKGGLFFDDFVRWWGADGLSSPGSSKNDQKSCLDGFYEVSGRGVTDFY